MARYAPTPYEKLKQIMDYLKLSSDDVLVDLGCGKGRVLFVAAEQKVKKIIGVELDQKLTVLAHENIRNLRSQCSPIEIVNTDAATFPVEEGTVFFLFDPFGLNTCDKVIDNIEASLIIHPRSIRIVYVGDELRFVLNRQDWLESEAEIDNGDVLICRNNSYVTSNHVARQDVGRKYANTQVS